MIETQSQPSPSTDSAIGRRGLLALPLAAVAAACGPSSTTTAPATTTSAAGGGSEVTTTPAPTSTSTIAPAPSVVELTAKRENPELHLAKRATFGATPEVVESIVGLGRATWLEQQLQPAGLDTGAVDAKISTLPALAITDPSESLAVYLQTQQAPQARLQLQLATVIRAVESPAQLYERMVEFWSDHFNVPADGNYLGVMRHHLDLDLREHALGRFKDLVVAVTRSPAMMEYLDNYKSRAGAINENFARELLELHTVGVDGPYNEADVVDTARLLTGWTMLRRQGRFAFADRLHDDGAVDIMGWTRPAGSDHEQHGVDFLHWLAVHPDTAAFVCTKLARRFVSDDPSPELVSAMTNTWLAGDSEIAPVLRTMFEHDEFGAAAGAKFNRPLDFTYSLLRRLQADITPTTGTGELRAIALALEALGQIPMTWPSPDGFPDTEAAWLNTGALLNRWNFIGDVVAGATGAVSFDGASFVADLAGSDATTIFESLAQRLTMQPLTTAGHALLESFTGWSGPDVPDATQLGETLPLVAVALLGSGQEMYR